jgi:hypothetical protein
LIRRASEFTPEPFEVIETSRTATEQRLGLSDLRFESDVLLFGTTELGAFQLRTNFRKIKSRFNSSSVVDAIDIARSIGRAWSCFTDTIECTDARSLDRGIV